MKINISVIVPTYNRSKYICESIDSILNQDFDKSLFEVIVVDDGSTDGTQELIKQYGNRIRYYKIPHSGKPAVARNFGINKAKGSIIAFQDSDDIWAQDKLKSQIKYFESSDVVLVYGQSGVIDEKGEKTNSNIVNNHLLSKGEAFNDLLKTNVISTLTVMAKKEVIEEVGFFNEKDSCRGVEDYELWLKILSIHPKGIRCTDKTLAYYRRHNDNISDVGNLKALDGILNVFKELLFFNLTEKQRKSLKKQIKIMNENYVRLSKENKPIDKPLVSIIMGVHNGEEYLQSSIESVLSQTFDDFEFIIIDDGSVDNSAKIVQAFDDPRIVFMQQKNEGLAKTLDKGIVMSRGKYIARQDQDDISLPTRLEKELQLLISRPSIGVVGTFFTYFDENTLEPKETISQPFKDIDIRRSLLIHNPIGHGTAMFKKSVYEKIGPYTDELGPIEDFQLWLKASDVCDFAIVPENLYLYRLNSTGMSSIGKEEQKIQTAKLIKKQWLKKFPHKASGVIVSDGNFYKNSSSPFNDQLYRQYLSQNYHIAIECINKGWTSWGLQIILALRKLDKSYFNEVRLSFVKAFCRKILFRGSS